MMSKLYASFYCAGSKLREIFAADGDTDGMGQGTAFKSDGDSVVDNSSLGDVVQAGADGHGQTFGDYFGAGFV